jgi:hypothetical protein
VVYTNNRSEPQSKQQVGAGPISRSACWGNDVEDFPVEVLFMGRPQSAHPPVVRVSGRAQAELRAGEVLVFDWTGLAFCCAVAGEINLPTTSRRRNACRSTCRFRPTRVPLCSPVFAHQCAHPVLVGRDIQIAAGVAWASASSPPRCHPTSDCAGRSGAKPAWDLVTTGRTRLRTLMLQVSTRTQRPRQHCCSAHPDWHF